VASVATLAPAKLNLGLRVVARRDDGYHLLESLFVPLELADELAIEVSPGPPTVDLELESPDPEVPVGDRNLAVAAARAFLSGAGDPELSVRIRLRKRIPAAAGLGGGSSDAAAVLRALAQLVPGGPDAAGLAELALGLGADVPFFLGPGAALVTGVGEGVEPVAGLRPLWVALANPGLPLSTAAVFALYDDLSGCSSEGNPARPHGLTPPDPRPTMRALFGPERESDALARLAGSTNGFTNDLEAAAIRLCPPIARLRQRMRERGAVVAGMSGSGATVYGVFRSEGEARGALAGPGLEPPTWTCVTRLRESGNERGREANDSAQDR